MDTSWRRYFIYRSKFKSRKRKIILNRKFRRCDERIGNHRPCLHQCARQIFGIDQPLFDQWDVHVHVPAGATPKDGPSAGITMLTALTSAFTQHKVKSNLAMTGEITLRGKVLPVGGIKEKILAAKRANIKEIILCKSNRKIFLKLKNTYIKDLKFHYVTEMREVIELALMKDKVKNAQDLSYKIVSVSNPN